MAVRGIVDENGYISFEEEIMNIESLNISRDVSELDELYYNDYRMIFYFKYYVIQIHGSDVWYDLLDQKKFRKLFYCTVRAYGEAIFSSIVDMAVDYLSLPLNYIFADFAKYIKSVESYELKEFAKYD